jgi:PiT family inorganic phosphate transporter
VTIVAFVLLAALFVAYANGANDNFKGVATLFGSGTSGYRWALAWGTIATFAGSMAALVLSEKLIARFGGRGLVPDAVVADPAFVGAVATGAALTVLLATVLSLPISTTHALVGGLVGAGWVHAGGSVQWSALGASFFLPLIASPLAAMVLSILFYSAAHGLRLWTGIRREACVCLNRKWVPVALAPGAAAAAAAEKLEVATCEERYQGTILAVSVHDALDGAHYLSAGAVSFARGLNDTPKIVALLAAAQALGVGDATIAVGAAMALGAILQARGVAETMSRRLTSMNHGQGLSANLVTAVLVVFASRFGLPVSTTHVSCGSILGIGVTTRGARWKMVGAVVSAWGLTLPAAAALAAIASAAR